MRESHLKSIHELSSDVLKNNSSDFMFGQCYLQAMDFIESKICKSFIQKTRAKSPENLYSIFFDSKVVEFITIARILRDSNITSSLLTTFVKFPILVLTYKLGLPLSDMIFNFNQFVSTLDLDVLMLYFLFEFGY